MTSQIKQQNLGCDVTNNFQFSSALGLQFAEDLGNTYPMGASGDHVT
jgi:hypothetical protein